jgi:hypothetical protein
MVLGDSPRDRWQVRARLVPPANHLEKQAAQVNQ